MRVDGRRVTALLAVAILTSLVSSGCATKKYVQTKVVQPLEAKLGAVDKKVDEKTAENASRITDLDRKTEQGISNAQAAADNASKEAAKAGEQAQQAQQLARKGVDEAGQLAQQVDNIDNYQPVKNAAILFHFNSSELTTEGKQQLDSLVQSLSGLKHYVIAVKGFTDSTGPRPYNLQLSERRADAVVRYLTLQGKVPLVRIHILGYGEDEPVAPNRTRQGRQENRRVEVDVLAPQTTAASNSSQPGSAAVTP